MFSQTGQFEHLQERDGCLSRPERRFVDVVRKDAKGGGCAGRESTHLLPVCFSSIMSLREISENVKLAREYALLGNYNSASVLYHGLLEQIKKYAYTLRDSSFQQRWQQVRIFSEEKKKALHLNSWASFSEVNAFLSCGKK